jgi:hypothetical protein
LFLIKFLFNKNINSSAPEANIPHQAFMKEFHIKYHEQDYSIRKKDPKFRDEFLYRQDVIERAKNGTYILDEGAPIGPFYGRGMDKKKGIIVDEREIKQVYTYSVDRHIFKNKEEREALKKEKFTDEEHRLQ